MEKCLKTQNCGTGNSGRRNLPSKHNGHQIYGDDITEQEYKNPVREIRRKAVDRIKQNILKFRSSFQELRPKYYLIDNESWNTSNERA